MGTIEAVTFDFHDTLVRAESWLQLEIRTLPSVVLGRLAAWGDLPAAVADPDLQDQAVTLYGGIREEARTSGREVTALDGVVRVLAALGLAGAVDRTRVEAALAEAQRACLADSRAVPGAGPVLAALQAGGRQLAVVSSAAYPPFVAWGLTRYGLAGYFPVVATSAATGYYKSDPRLYAWALAQLGVDPARAVHIGDHPRFDVQGAQAAGMRAILFTGAIDRRAAGSPECRPDATIAALADLPAALARLEAG